MADEKTNKSVTLSPQQLVSLYQNQRALVDSLFQQDEFMKNALVEVIGSEEALKEIDSVEKDVRVLFLLGSGVFLEAEVKDKRVRSEIGGGVVQKVTIKKALKNLGEKIKNIESNREKLRKKIQEGLIGLSKLEQTVAKLEQAMAAAKKTSPNSVS